MVNNSVNFLKENILLILFLPPSFSYTASSVFLIRFSLLGPSLINFEGRAQEKYEEIGIALSIFHLKSCEKSKDGEENAMEK